MSNYQGQVIVFNCIQLYSEKSISIILCSLPVSQVCFFFLMLYFLISFLLVLTMLVEVQLVICCCCEVTIPLSALTAADSKYLMYCAFIASSRWSSACEKWECYPPPGSCTLTAVVYWCSWFAAHSAASYPVLFCPTPRGFPAQDFPTPPPGEAPLRLYFLNLARFSNRWSICDRRGLILNYLYLNVYSFT